jgi:DNA-binding transcriptional regulator YiaG
LNTEKRGERFTFSWGRIALLAFTQRQIRVSRAHIPLNRHRRKHIPTVIKTTGDYIQAKRYEKGLHPYQIAGKMGIETALILAWESGTRTPDEKQWQMLSDLLSFDFGVDFPKPHRGCLLAFTQSKSQHLSVNRAADETVHH